jgi:hypothetical protein
LKELIVIFLSVIFLSVMFLPLQGPLAMWVEVETCSVMLNHLLMCCELHISKNNSITIVICYFCSLQGPLATWVEVETCSVMLSHLLMGFELQLYEPADYAMIYW